MFTVWAPNTMRFLSSRWRSVKGVNSVGNCTGMDGLLSPGRDRPPLRSGGAHRRIADKLFAIRRPWKMPSPSARTMAASAAVTPQRPRPQPRHGETGEHDDEGDERVRAWLTAEEHPAPTH